MSLLWMQVIFMYSVYTKYTVNTTSDSEVKNG